MGSVAVERLEAGLSQAVVKGWTAFHLRRESITGKSLASFPEENTSMPYSGFEPETTWLQAEGHIYHTGWVADIIILEYECDQRSLH
ncbi:hypothetical protein TNCV_2127681 [Trichonephila clavipes]|nr:hypothetical protein TNCV_2127681 [Trichonephila clavipes]